MTPQTGSSSGLQPVPRTSFPWAWTAATVAPAALAGLVLRAMIGRALMPVQAGYLLMILALCFLACCAGLQLAWRLVRRGSPALWLTLASLLPAALGAWTAVRGAWSIVEAAEVSIVERQLAPVTRALSSGVADLAGAVPSPAPRGLAIWRDGSEFLVSVEGGSIDIDGSTLYLDSSLAGWRRFYDGSEGEAAKRFEARSSSLPKVWPRPKPAAHEE